MLFNYSVTRLFHYNRNKKCKFKFYIATGCFYLQGLFQKNIMSSNNVFNIHLSYI